MIKYALALALATATPAMAAQDCTTTEDMREMLSVKFGERQYSAALAQSYLVETWVNETTHSWTIILTDIDGVSCLMASGVGFSVVTRGNV
jgi:hypothetical protein